MAAPILKHPPALGEGRPRVWLLAGTGEGPPLAEALGRRGWQVRVSVVSAAAALAYQPRPWLQLAVGAIGGDDAAFRTHGAFLGLAEQVDAGNADRGDKALVFSENIVRDDMSHDEALAALGEGDDGRGRARPFRVF